MLWRIASPIISHCQSWSPGPVEFCGPSPQQQFFQSLLNHCHLVVGIWLRMEAKTVESTSGFSNSCWCWRSFTGNPWKSIMELFLGNPIKVPYHPLFFFSKPVSKAMAQLQLGLYTWRRWRSCLLAAWLSLTDPNNGRHEKPDMPQHRVWDSLSGFLKSTTYIQYHSMQRNSR